jgi:TolA-binding protein
MSRPRTNDTTGMGITRAIRALLCATLLSAAVATSSPAAERDGEGRSAESGDALRAYRTANGLLNRGLYDLAAAEYRSFLAAAGDSPHVPTARYGLGVCLFRTGKTTEAVEVLSPLLSTGKFEFAAEALMVLAQAQATEQRWSDAATTLRKLLDRHGEHTLASSASALLVDVLSRTDARGEVIAEAESALNRSTDPASAQRIRMHKGLAHLALGQTEEARGEFRELVRVLPEGSSAARATLLLAQCEQTLNDPKSAIRLYRRGIDMNGAEDIRADALLGLGSLLRAQGEARESAQVLDRLLTEFPETPLRGAALLERGRAYMSLESWDEALVALDESARLAGSQQDDAAYWAAKCVFRRGDAAEAARRLDGALGQFPESAHRAEMLYDRAVALYESGADAESASVLARFREGSPDHVMSGHALYLAALLDYRGGRYTESLSKCRAFQQRFSGHDLSEDAAFTAFESLYLSGASEEAAVEGESFLRTYARSPRRPTVECHVGIALHRLGKYAEARRHLQKVVPLAEQDATLLPARAMLADICFRASEWKEAARHLEGFVGAKSDETYPELVADALLKLGLCYSHLQQYPEALSTLDRLIGRYPEGPQARHAGFERGQVLLALGRGDEADAAFRQVREGGDAGPLKAYADYHMGVLAQQRGDASTAVEHLRRAVDDAPDPSSRADAMFRLGEALLAGGSYAEAETVFQRFLQTFATHPRRAEAGARGAVAICRQDRYEEALPLLSAVEGEVASSPALARLVAYERAWCLARLGRRAESIRAYRAVLALGRRQGEPHPHAMLDLAGLQMEDSDWNAAAALLKELCDSLDTRSGAGETGGAPSELKEQAIYRLGVCAYRLNDFAQAAELLGRFLREFGSSAMVPSASYLCGESLYQTGEHSRCVPHFERVVRDYPSDPACEASVLRLGDSLAVLQRWAASEQTFASYLERFGERPHAYEAQFGLGWARENQGRYEEAIGAYRVVTERHLGETTARAQFQIGECLFAQKRYDQAVTELLKVDILFADPKWSAAALYEAGRCFTESGKFVEAAARFREVVEKHGQTKWAPLAEKQLTEVAGRLRPGG